MPIIIRSLQGRFQFSLRTALVVTTLISLVLGYLVNHELIWVNIREWSLPEDKSSEDYDFKSSSLGASYSRVSVPVERVIRNLGLPQEAMCFPDVVPSPGKGFPELPKTHEAFYEWFRTMDAKYHRVALIWKMHKGEMGLEFVNGRTPGR